MATRPTLPEVSPDAMERLTQIEQLRDFRERVIATKTTVYTHCTELLEPLCKEATNLALDPSNLPASLDVFTATFDQIEAEAVAAQLRLIDQHRSAL